MLTDDLSHKLTYTWGDADQDGNNYHRGICSCGKWTVQRWWKVDVTNAHKQHLISQGELSMAKPIDDVQLLTFIFERLQDDETVLMVSKGIAEDPEFAKLIPLSEIVEMTMKTLGNAAYSNILDKFVDAGIKPPAEMERQLADIKIKRRMTIVASRALEGAGSDTAMLMLRLIASTWKQHVDYQEEWTIAV